MLGRGLSLHYQGGAALGLTIDQPHGGLGIAVRSGRPDHRVDLRNVGIQITHLAPD
jgi:hypothetical protein